MKSKFLIIFFALLISPGLVWATECTDCLSAADDVCESAVSDITDLQVKAAEYITCQETGQAACPCTEAEREGYFFEAVGADEDFRDGAEKTTVEPLFYDLEVPIGLTTRVSGIAEYIGLIYTFGVSITGLLAAVMIMFGGWMWIFAAGNEGTITAAKERITSAIIGLALALGSYLILFTINPQLVELPRLAIDEISVDKTADANCSWAEEKVADFVEAASSYCAGNEPGDDYECYCRQGGCTAASRGACSVDSLRAYGGSCFGSDEALEKASAICQGESAGIVGIASGVDKCEPGGEAVSFGLFQVNISANRVGGLDCPSAFEGGPYTGSDHTCTVVNQTLYNQCVEFAKNPLLNVQVACSLYSTSRGFKHWGYNNTHCYWTK